MKTLNENTTLNLDIKTLIIIITFTISMVTMYAKLQADILEARDLPKPTLTATEWQIKDELIRTTVQQNAKGIEEIKSKLNTIEERLYEINK
jgi:Mg2+ and Co2+ transporter CorA|tara:strand:+ start:1389 stop:1664 length:276 start_codon:yes stop_codon:yes gene_type:complete